MHQGLKKDLSEGFEFLGVEFGAQFKWVYLAWVIGMTWVVVTAQYFPYTPRTITEFFQLQSVAGNNSNYCRAQFPFLRR